MTVEIEDMSSLSLVTSSMNYLLLMVIWLVRISLSALEFSSYFSRFAILLCKFVTVFANLLLSVMTSDIFSEDSLSLPRISVSKFEIFLL